MSGLVFDVQRFSVHDGPGIRTTVFMKGCPLRCQWCHNPEGLSPEIQLQFFEDRCIGCGQCGKRETLADARNCPTGALTVCGKTVTAEEIVSEILKDRIFYGKNGGVTFSGGECLLQADFVAAVLKRIKEFGFHCAIDTSGFVPFSAFEKTLDFCDLYLYDVKCVDPARHKKYTGAENGLILENLKRLSTCGKEIWIRIPVIPGFNDDIGEMTAVADLLETIPSISQVTLMPYHTLGAGRYATLGLTYPFTALKKITESEMETIKRCFADRKLLLN